LFKIIYKTDRMFSYKKATDRAIAALNDNGTLTKILYIHDKFSLPRLTRDPAKDEIILRDLFETDELDPDTEFFEILPESRRGQTDRIVLCAGSGSGKSTWIATYIKNFLECFPDCENVILFTRQDEEDFDKAYDKFKDRINHVQIDETILEDPLTLHDIADPDGKPRLILFDDYTDAGEKKINAAVESLRDDISANGRKLGLYLICAQTDMPTLKAGFRNILGNCSMFVTFPQRSTANIKYTLETYFNVTGKVWKAMKESLKSRWIVVTRNDQPYILWRTGCLIFDSDRLDDDVKTIESIKKKLMNKHSDKLVGDMLLRQVKDRIPRD
jgi:hypothetical protein